MGRSVDHEAAVEEGGRGRGEWRVSEWKWQEGRKAGGQSLITREGREGQRLWTGHGRSSRKQGRIHAVCFMRDTAGAYLTVVLWHASYWMPVMIW